MIPNFQTIMLPLLEFYSDNKEHAKREAVEYISNKFSLSEEERTRAHSKSGVRIVSNRVHWSGTFLNQAGLLERLRPGYFKITKRGLDVLKEKPKKIDVKFLKQFPEFTEFLNRRGKRDKETDQEIALEKLDLPPIELLEKGYNRIRDDLAQELLKQVKECSPEFFEKLVVELLLKMGYGGSREDAGKVIGRTGDGGIDGIIKQDKLGLDVIYIQAKRWDSSVGAPAINQFIGALAHRNANKGVFITTSVFTDAARNAIQGPYRVILMDGELLSQYMIDYNIGVFTKTNYEVKEIDSDYFSEE